MVMLDPRTGEQHLYGLHTVRKALDWENSLGLQYAAWFSGVDSYGATTEGNDLTAYGWTVTGAPPYVLGSAADFASSSDKGTTGGVHLDTASDVIQSPPIFGSYSHMEAICQLIGAVAANGSPNLPAYLECIFGARFSANNAETGTGIGFIEDGGSAAVANDHMAALFTDGTSWKIRSGAATSAAIATDSTNPFIAKIRVDRINNLAYGWVDDFSVAGQSIAIQADEWPVAFGAGVVSAGSNDPVLNWVIVRYGWNR